MVASASSSLKPAVSVGAVVRVTGGSVVIGAAEGAAAGAGARRWPPLEATRAGGVTNWIGSGAAGRLATFLRLFSIMSRRCSMGMALMTALVLAGLWRLSWERRMACSFVMASRTVNSLGSLDDLADLKRSLMDSTTLADVSLTDFDSRPALSLALDRKACACSLSLWPIDVTESGRFFAPSNLCLKLSIQFKRSGLLA